MNASKPPPSADLLGILAGLLAAALFFAVVLAGTLLLSGCESPPSHPPGDLPPPAQYSFNEGAPAPEIYPTSPPKNSPGGAVNHGRAERPAAPTGAPLFCLVKLVCEPGAVVPPVSHANS